jgi:hypothetical protein
MYVRYGAGALSRMDAVQEKCGVVDKKVFQELTGAKEKNTDTYNHYCCE